MYVDALFVGRESKIKVVERVNGNRIYKDYPGIFEFYVDDPKGRFRSIHGTPVTRIQNSSHGEFKKAVRINSHKNKYESDIKPVNKIIETHYKHQNPPDLHIAFFDIETDFDKELGYSSPEDAICPIISVAVHLQWLGQTVCLAVPPEGMKMEDAQVIADRVGDTILFYEESHMLEAFLTLIEDADVLSGWFSEGYDIPFIVNRIMKTLGRNEARRMCLWDQMPRPKTFTRGGRESQTYELTGRVHLDYLELYKKFTYEERHSYKLDAIGEIEVGEKKVSYDGTLDELYNQDFEKFIRYNIQDTELLDKIDKKLQFISLASSIAHGNCVLMPAALGAVAVTEQAIVVEAHERDMKVPDRVRVGEDELAAAGGWVQHPKKGLHKWIGSSDLASLYPSVIRALNMSPETIIGQVRLKQTDNEIYDHLDTGGKFAEWWNDKFNTLELEHYLNNDNSERLTLDLEDGSKTEVTGKELRGILHDADWSMSANGTVFRNDIEGVIPGLLGRWYAERKVLQKFKIDYARLSDAKNPLVLDIPKDVVDDVQQKLDTKREAGDATTVNHYDPDLAFTIAGLKKKSHSKNSEDLYNYMLAHELTFDGADVRFTDSDKLIKIVSFWDKRQLVKKINLNSLYGGLLNIHCRFYDRRLGQSTTLTGRSIAKHMAAKTNEYLDGSYDHTGRSIIYGDTDSVYFSAYPILREDIDSGAVVWTKESVIELYDIIAQQVSDSFPDYMLETWNVPLDKGHIIAAGREVVAQTGLFIKKKRYALLVYDDEGTRKDVSGSVGKLKAMGLDLRRSDTPVVVQEFLKRILMEVLELHQENDVIENIRAFKKEFDKLKPWEKGAPTAVNNLTSYKEKLEYNMSQNFSRGRKMKKLTIPGHVMASINWNSLRESHNDLHVTRILDGSKVVVCRLKPNNDLRKTSVAFPVDEPHLPDWFINLPFDNEAMMQSIVDKKVENLLNVLDWDLSRTSLDAELMETLFDFS